MITNTDTINEYYTALLNKDSNYDGLFFVRINCQTKCNTYQIAPREVFEIVCIFLVLNLIK